MYENTSLIFDYEIPRLNFVVFYDSMKSRSQDSTE